MHKTQNNSNCAIRYAISIITFCLIIALLKGENGVILTEQCSCWKVHSIEFFEYLRNECHICYTVSYTIMQAIEKR